jgi:hypothetical protein
MANKVYQPIESAVTWKSSGGTETFTPTSLASAAGRQGAYHDFTAGSVGRRFRWRAELKPGSTRVVGETIEVYLLAGDGTHYDNDDGTTDAAVSAYDKLRNAALLGVIQIDENAAVAMGASGEVTLLERYAAPVFWNATANTLSTTAGDYFFSLTPVPDEIQ